MHVFFLYILNSNHPNLQLFTKQQHYISNNCPYQNMAKQSNPFMFYFLNITFLILLTSPPHAQAISRNNVCKSTRFPSYCSSVLPNNDAGIHDYGRLSLRKSLSQSQKFLNFINSYLQRNSVSLSQPTIRALHDCRELLSGNIDLLGNSVGPLNNTSKLLPSLEADDLQTHLSTVMTNLQTCSDGLEASPSVKNDVSQTLSDDSKLHSITLALCTEGWVPKQRDGESRRSRSHRVSSKGRLPMKMSDRARAVYDRARSHHPRGRKLLQVGDEEVVIKDIVIVSKDGLWNYTSINDAIAAAPNNSASSGGYFLIYVTAGVYEEYVNIASNKKYLFLLGDGINQTIITGSHSVGDGWTTFNSATLIVTGPGFLAVDITVRNTAGPSKSQAVALRSGADLSTFYRCSFEAYQDTLYTHSQRQFYRECDVYGTVDFIFGNAAVVLQNCNLYPRLPNKGQFNAITAQGRIDPSQNTGTSIQNCTVRPAGDLAASNGTTKTYLGRPWKEYSRTVYMQSFLDGFIDPAGWHEWSGDFALNTSYYAEYANWGPGSNTTNRVKWSGYHVIGATEAANFTVSTFLSGDNWLPRTGVPYAGGLM